MHNILIATDLTSNSAPAFDRAMQLAYMSGAKLHVLHKVTAVGYHKSEKEEFLKRTENKIREMVTPNEYGEKIDIFIHLAGRGRLYETIDEYAKKLWADIVVMGLTNKGKDTPSFVSSTVERVIHTGNYPVLMVSKPVTGLYKNVLLFMDMAALPYKAVRLTSQLSPDIFLHLVPAFNKRDSSELPRLFTRLKAKLRERRMEKFIRFSRDQLQKNNLPPERLNFRNIEDTSSNLLLAEAGKDETDLVAVEAHRYTTALHSRVEGMAGKLLEFAPCDILVTKRI